MKASTIIILLLLAVTFIPSGGVSSSEIKIDPMESEAYVAFLVNEDEVPKDNDVTECDCNGDGVLTHGDGHKTPCPCIDKGGCNCVKTSSESITQEQDVDSCLCESCECETCQCDGEKCLCEKCKKKENPPLKASTDMPYVVYYIGASWCAPCRAFKEQLNSQGFKNKGYKAIDYGDSTEGVHVIKLDYDKDKVFIRNKLGELPSTVPQCYGYDNKLNKVVDKFTPAGMSWQSFTQRYMKIYRGQGYE